MSPRSYTPRLPSSVATSTGRSTPAGLISWPRSRIAALVDTLSRDGAKVIGVVRTPAKGAWMTDHGVAMTQGDLTDRSSLVEAFSEADVVVSNAALGSRQGSMDDFERVNCRGIENLFAATRLADALIHLDPKRAHPVLSRAALEAPVKRTRAIAGTRSRKRLTGFRSPLPARKARLT